MCKRATLSKKRLITDPDFSNHHDLYTKTSCISLDSVFPHSPRIADCLARLEIVDGGKTAAMVFNKELVCQLEALGEYGFNLPEIPECITSDSLKALDKLLGLYPHGEEEIVHSLTYVFGNN